MKTMWKLFGSIFTRKDYATFGLTLILQAVTAWCVAFSLTQLLNVVAALGDNAQLIKEIGVYLMITVVFNVTQYSCRLIQSHWKATLANTMRERTFRRVLDMDTRVFHSFNTGVLQGVVNESSKDTLTIISAITDGSYAIVATFTSIFYVWKICPQVGILYLVGIPILVILSKYYWEIGKRAYDRVDGIKKKTIGQVSNAIKGFRAVKAFNNEAREYDALCKNDHEYTDTFMVAKKASNNNLVVNDLTSTGLKLATIGISWYVGLDAASILVLVNYSSSLFRSVSEVLGQGEDVQKAMVASEKVAELLRMENEIEDGELSLNRFSNYIRFDDVKFGYKDTDSVLNGVSFTVKKGQRIGICGPSGGGKSTILNLITRFYDVCKGAVVIDGVNIKDLTTESLRKRVGIVQQDSYLFEGTIRENIMYGKPGATEVEVVEAARKANIHDFVSSLELGYDTLVGDNGIKLSGGQKQRVAIARVFLQDPDIILFDEATAALDNSSEKIIQESIDRLSEDKTVITVAHRLSTIRNCDKILVIDDHKIVEEGTYDELVKAGGVFTSLVNK